MYKNKTILALVPARGASKGLPKKNIRPLCGKPLMAWSIEQALGSRYVDNVMVSTDSPPIASVAHHYGAEVPFLRPKSLASDQAKSSDVVLHAMAWMEKNSRRFDLILLLQTTSPLRTPADIDAGIERLLAKKAKAVVSVCQMEHSPLWCNTLPKSQSLKNFIPKPLANKNRQALPSFYRLNGAIYLADWAYFKKHKGFLGPQSVALVMPRERSVDIDSQEDFEFAAFLKQKYGL